MGSCPAEVLSCTKGEAKVFGADLANITAQTSPGKITYFIKELPKTLAALDRGNMPKRRISPVGEERGK